MSNQTFKAQDGFTGACPLEDPETSFKNPPLTLSQKLQKTRSEQQAHENQRKADLDRRNTEIITKFIVEHIEPLLEAQALSGLSKTVYKFIVSGIEQKELMSIIAENEDTVEGFGNSGSTGSYTYRYNTKEYVKVIRLKRPEYNLEFWQQPTVMEELEQTLKLRLQANGEKLADTARNSTGRSWYNRSFSDGETLLPGHTGIQLTLHTSKNYPQVTFVELYAEIA